MLNDILTKAKLTALIETLVKNEHLTYIEAAIQICEEREIDPLDIGKLISPPIKDKIEAEARLSRMLPPIGNLSEFIK